MSWSPEFLQQILLHSLPLFNREGDCPLLPEIERQQAPGKEVKTRLTLPLPTSGC